MLLCDLNVRTHKFGLGLEAIHAWHLAGVEKTGHVHRVTAKSLAVNTMVKKNMTIIPIIMPAFQKVLVFKIAFELQQHSLSVSVVVNKKSWPITKVDVRSDKS